MQRNALTSPVAWLFAALAVGLASHLAGLALYARNDTREPFDASQPADLLIVAGIALAAGSLAALAILWRLRVSASSREAAVLRTAAVPAVALIAAGAVWLASGVFGDGRDVDTIAVAQQQHESAPEAVQTPVETHADHSATPVAAAGQGEPHTHTAEVAVTADDLAAASALVAALKAHVAPYEDIAAALSDGYVQITQDLEAIAAHFVRMDYLDDGHELDPERPEFLLYSKRLDGSWRLLGVMFYAEEDSDEPPSYFGALDAWHYHEKLCFTVMGVRVAENAAACAGGQFVEKTRWQLHAWTLDGATGVFAHDYAPITPGAFPAAIRSAAAELRAGQ